jgi:hypothetical protein
MLQSLRRAVMKKRKVFWDTAAHQRAARGVQRTRRAVMQAA